ncbi:MAG: hydroxyacid dehydrogenase [Deltaproteobacteria bacterium]|nr:hydroxyacid dehydrogenase [Deltaproteobacteria bacterium]MBI3063281.1 hydroxyacid dehydrogenase [Deltaproteobacteria bacterium]
MSLGRVLVETFHPEVLEWLRARAEVVIVDPWSEPERWEKEAPQVDAVISRKGRITREQMEKSRGRLKIIARTGVGVDPSRVDLDAAREHRVWVTNMPGSNAVSVAELVFGQMIALARHTQEANRAVKENRWGDYLRFAGAELAGKTVGVVGMGNIGTRVAIRARAFEMAFLVYDPYIPESHVTALGGRWTGLDELLAESDFVTLHCPLTDETKRMIGEKELSLMKSSAYFINMARGGIVDEEALYRLLSRQGIAGAALDVVEDEPPRPDHPLFRLDNVIFTPHLAAITREASKRGEWGAAEEVIRVLQGQSPKNPVT